MFCLWKGNSHEYVLVFVSHRTVSGCRQLPLCLHLQYVINTVTLHITSASSSKNDVFKITQNFTPKLVSTHFLKLLIDSA